jgi:hypothetical protein
MFYPRIGYGENETKSDAGNWSSARRSCSLDQGRKLAAWIPGARFVPLDSDSRILPARHEAGRMFIAETIEFLGGGRPDKPRISRRQTQILGLVAQGMTDKQVARELGLSPHRREACRPRAARLALRQPRRSRAPG